MIVVSDTSPLMNLAVVGRLGLLESLYGEIFIPEAVREELLAIGSVHTDVTLAASLAWIKVRAVTNHAQIGSLMQELDRGEAEAVGLAVEMNAKMVLVDERMGRRVASRLGLRVIGLLGVLVEAKNKGLVAHVKPILDDVIAQAGFWVSPPLYARVLRETEE